MENTTSPPLATESFSYSWLANTPNSSLAQHKTISNNDQSFPLLDETNQNFDFDISISKSYHSSLVHADKLFSNGLILPQSLDKHSNNIATCSIADSCSYSSSSSSPSPLLVNSKIHHTSGKWSTFIPGKIVIKYIKRLIPMKRSIGRSGTRVNDVNRLTWEVKNRSNTSSNTPQVASPRKEFGAHSSYWNEIDENSISEAILYCKRSSGLC